MTDPIPYWEANQTFDPEIRIDSVQEHPDNYNQADEDLLARLLDSHGLYGGVIVQKSTRHIIVGNHRYRVAKSKGAETIPGFLLDVDDDEAAEILASDNLSARLSTFDEVKLVALLRGRAESPRGLGGTGYTGDSLDAMIGALGGNVQLDAPTGAEWAETDEDQEKRKEHIGEYNDRTKAGALVEMILVFLRTDREEALRLVGLVRKATGQPDMRGAEIMLRGLRTYHRLMKAGTETVVAGDLAARAAEPVPDDS